MKVFGQLETAQFENRSVAPGAPSVGQIYADITTPGAAVPLFWTGSSWVSMLGGGGGGGGTVTAVALALPASVFSVFGSPVNVSGTLQGVFINQTANTVFAGPTAGPVGTPAFRALVGADVPNLDASKITSGILPVARGGTGIAAPGANGNVLTSNGAGSWLSLPPSGGGGGNAFATTPKSANYTAAPFDAVMADCTGGTFAVTLPDATVNQDAMILVKRKDASGNTVNVNTVGGQTIDGAASLALPAKASVMVISDGANWYLI